MFKYFSKIVEKIKFSMLSDKKNGHFTQRSMYIFNPTSPSSSYNEKCFKHKLLTNSKHILCSVAVFFFENCIICEVICKETLNSQTAADDNMAQAHCILDT